MTVCWDCCYISYYSARDIRIEYGQQLELEQQFQEQAYQHSRSSCRIMSVDDLSALKCWVFLYISFCVLCEQDHRTIIQLNISPDGCEQLEP
jgi:hypothetical protein